MNLLTSNGERGKHAPSWYSATNSAPDYPQLSDDISCDVCVIGAGYTGLSTAIHLRKLGHSVTLIDAHRVGWGASGRNGGQLGSGLNIDQSSLEKQYGVEHAKAVWQICENAKRTIFELCSEFNIDAKYKPGIISALNRARLVKSSHQYCEKLANDYGYTQLEPLSKSDIRSLVDSPLYHGGVLDHGAGHIHPLALATGLAKAANELGVQLYENTRAVGIASTNGGESQVETEHATIRSPVVVLACNGYLDDLNKNVCKHVMPINNFIVATEPLGEQAKELLSGNHAVFDSRFVVNYFKLSHDNRLLFGGGETYSYKFPDNIAALVQKPLLQVFPQLKNVQLEYAWGGTLAITRNRAPFIRKLEPQVYSASGYSGHGVALSVETGKLIAQDINGHSDGFNTLSTLNCGQFPGGAKTRSVLLKAGMSFYSMLDKF